MKDYKEKFNLQIKDNIKTHLSLLTQCDNISYIINKITKSIRMGGKIMFCGNGGSAGDAQHLAAEYLVRLRSTINRRPIAAISLAQDTSTITACGNDYGYDQIFLRPFQALAKKNDILIAISTSGNSRNILKVLKEAKKKKIFSLGFLGDSGGSAKKICTKAITVDSKITARIQECHIFIGHFILEEVEDNLLSRK
jgi:D-sedoheptulose 7-phosphate isomerase